MRWTETMTYIRKEWLYTHVSLSGNSSPALCKISNANKMQHVANWKYTTDTQELDKKAERPGIRKTAMIIARRSRSREKDKQKGTQKKRKRIAAGREGYGDH